MEPKTTSDLADINSVTILGRVVAEPVKRGTEDHPAVTFSVATHGHYKHGSGEKFHHTDCHRVCVFKQGLRESVLGNVKKGQRVYVTGHITYRSMMAEDGKQQATMKIIANDVQIHLSGQNIPPQ